MIWVNSYSSNQMIRAQHNFIAEGVLLHLDKNNE